jgi:hypothetical protein
MKFLIDFRFSIHELRFSALHSRLTKNPALQGRDVFPAVPPGLPAAQAALHQQLFTAIDSLDNARVASQTTRQTYAVHLSGSRGNFGQFLPGEGFSLCPAPPCWRRQMDDLPGVLSSVIAFYGGLLALLSSKRNICQEM